MPLVGNLLLSGPKCSWRRISAPFGGDAEGAHADAASFPNNCNPLAGLQRRLTTRLVSPQSDCPTESNKNPPLSSQVGALDKHAEERSAVHSSVIL